MKEKNKQTFPEETSIKYGFLYFNKDVLATLGFQKGDRVTLQQWVERLRVTNEVKKVS